MRFRFQQFIKGLLVLPLAACTLSDGSRSLVLVPNPIGVIGYEIEKRTIKGPNEGGSIFMDVWSQKEKSLDQGFRQLCEKHSYNQSNILPISGFRILQVIDTHSNPARGFPTTLDFYSSFSSRNAKANSIVEAIQTAIAIEKLPISLEFQDKLGEWKISTLNIINETIETVPTSRLEASHGIIFNQVLTNKEKEFSIFGAEITVIDLATNEVVAKNIGFAKDIYLGAHNRFALIAGSNRCGHPFEDNFVGSWLSSLIRIPVAGSIDPYDGFKKRMPIKNENRHWASHE